jgi:hypothetical protein
VLFYRAALPLSCKALNFAAGVGIGRTKHGIVPIGLPAAETARIEIFARGWKTGILTAARLAFHLRWSAWRRRHQTRARWHHYAARLQALTT